MFVKLMFGERILNLDFSDSLIFWFLSLNTVGNITTKNHGHQVNHGHHGSNYCQQIFEPCWGGFVL